MTATTTMPDLRAPDERLQRLQTTRRRATTLLGAVSVVFLAVTLWGGEDGWAGYVQATAEAAMVGGLADWFAVVALFRHPLGIPIPHTAVIVARKDQFGATLGSFIQEAFLTPDAIVARLQAAEVGPRLAAWLREPANADRLAAELLDGAVQLADLVGDADVQAALHGALRARLESLPVAPLAGRALEAAIRDGRHQDALDSVLREAERTIDANRDELRTQLADASPWWLPGAAEDRLFERLLDGAHVLIGALLDDRDHAMRQRFEERLVALAHDLQTAPEWQERGEALKQELLDQPELADWLGSLWDDLKDRLRDEATSADSELRRRLAEVVVGLGRRLEDPAMAERLDDGLCTAVTYLADRFHGEIVNLVGGTIERWDAAETADRLELLLGPDLQFIRINGTVVGALAGLGLHTVAQVLG